MEGKNFTLRLNAAEAEALERIRKRLNVSADVVAVCYAWLRIKLMVQVII